jgi:hypothetical protein
MFMKKKTLKWLLYKLLDNTKSILFKTISKKFAYQLHKLHTFLKFDRWLKTKKINHTNTNLEWNNQLITNKKVPSGYVFHTSFFIINITSKFHSYGSLNLQKNKLYQTSRKLAWKLFN